MSKQNSRPSTFFVRRSYSKKNFHGRFHGKSVNNRVFKYYQSNIKKSVLSKKKKTNWEKIKVTSFVVVKSRYNIRLT